MEFGEENVGIWGREPEVSAEEQARSSEIDAALRESQLGKMRSACSVLVLAESSAEACRQVVADSLTRALAEQQEEWVDVSKEDTEERPDTQVIISTSFPTSKKNKESQLKLAAADPSVLVYVVSADCDAESDEELAKQLVKAFQKSLSHLLFVGQAIGTLHQSAACIVFSNCTQIRQALKRLDGNESFLSKLQKNFLNVQSSEPDQVLLGILTELETAFQSFNVQHIRSVVVDEAIHLMDNAEGSMASLAEQMLGVINSVQASRIESVRTADMQGAIFNAKPREAQVTHEENAKREEVAEDKDWLLFVGIIGAIVAAVAWYYMTKQKVLGVDE